MAEDRPPRTGEEPWPERPDAWAEADRRWSERGGDAPDDAPPPAAPRRTGPAPSPRSVTEAYGEGMREAGPYLGLGMQIAGALALFTGGGYLLDRALGSSPWGLLGGAALGFVALLALVVRLSNTAGRGKPKG